LEWISSPFVMSQLFYKQCMWPVDQIHQLFNKADKRIFAYIFVTRDNIYKIQTLITLPTFLNTMQK